VVAAALLAAALFLARKRVPPLRGAFLLLALTLLLSPTVHPWYLLWIMPFLPFFPSRAWLLLTGLIPLSYLDSAPVAPVASGALQWVRAIEYLPFYALLLFDWARFRRASATSGSALVSPPEPGGATRQRQLL